MTFQVPVLRVASIETHPDQPKNSVVELRDYSPDKAHTVITMKNEDGSFRFNVNDLVVFVPENAIVPDEILKRTGFWNEAKNKGGLAGSKGNRVKPRAGSEGLIWAAQTQAPIFESLDGTVEGETRFKELGAVFLGLDETPHLLTVGEDTVEIFGIMEYKAK